MDDIIKLPRDYGTEILRVEVGSTLHGTGLGVAKEDLDLMGVFVERPWSTIGLTTREHYVKRTAAEGERSTADDIDLVVYSLRKWARLALNGNPSVILLFFAPPDKVMLEHELGTELRAQAPNFASLRAGKAFLGYMEQQRQRMTGQRGKAGRVRVVGECEACGGSGVGGVAAVVGLMNDLGGTDVLRQEMPCEKCKGTGQAIDWKYAMHMLRLGFQGIEFLETGQLTLPVPGDIGDYLREVRQGLISFDDVIAEAEDLERQVKELLDGRSILPPEPQTEKVEQWVIHTHLEVWGYA